MSNMSRRDYYRMRYGQAGIDPTEMEPQSVFDARSMDYGIPPTGKIIPESKEIIAAKLANKDNTVDLLKRNRGNDSSVFGTNVSSDIENIINQQKISKDGSQTNTKTTSYADGSSQKIIDSTPKGVAGNTTSSENLNKSLADYFGESWKTDEDLNIIRTPSTFNNPDGLVLDMNEKEEEKSTWAKTMDSIAGIAALNFKTPDSYNSDTKMYLENKDLFDSIKDGTIQSDDVIRKNNRIAAMRKIMDKGFKLPLFKRSIGLENILGVNPTRGEAELNAYNKSLNVPEDATSAATRIAKYQENFGKGIPNNKDGKEFSYVADTILNNIADEKIKQKRKFSFDDYVSPGNPNDQTMLMDRGEIFADSMADQANSFIQNDLSNKMSPSEIFEDSMEGEVLSKANIIEPAELNEDGSVKKFPKVDEKSSADAYNPNTDVESILKGENTPTSEMTKLVLANGEAIENLKILQEQVDKYQQSPEMIKKAYDSFLKESGWLKNSNEDLFKGLVGFASAMVMGLDVTDALGLGFGIVQQQKEEEIAAREERKAKFVELLKDSGPYMNDTAWEATLERLGFDNADDIEYMNLFRDLGRTKLNTTSAESYIEDVQAMEKELKDLLIHPGMEGNQGEYNEYVALFNYAQSQYKSNPENFLKAKEQIAQAFTQWQDYKLSDKAKGEGPKRIWFPWTWNNKENPNVLSPIVFFENLHGLVDLDGKFMMSVKADDPNYALIGEANLYLNNMFANDQNRIKEASMKIAADWSKNHKNKTGSKYKNKEDYSEFFIIEVNKLVQNRTSEIISGTRQ